jgi:hypothetical protein
MFDPAYPLPSLHVHVFTELHDKCSMRRQRGFFVLWGLSINSWPFAMRLYCLLTGAHL